MLKTLRAKLLAGMILASLVPIIVLAGWSIKIAVDNVDCTARDFLTASVTEQQSALENRAAVVVNQAILLSKAHALHTGSATEIAKLFADTKSTISGADVVLYTDRTGKSDLNTSGTVLDLSTREYVQKALRGEPASQIVVSKVDGKVVLIGAAPVVNSRGNVTGTVAIAIDIQSDARLHFAHLGSTGERYIANREGYFVTDSRFTTDAILKQKVSDKILDIFKPGASPSYFGSYKDYRGVEVYGAHAYIPSLDMVAVAEMDRSELFASVYATARLLGVLALVGLALTGVISWVIAQRITARIAPVVSGAKAVAGGDLSFTYTALEDPDEIGELSRAFASMISDLKDLIRRIQQSSLTLAERASLISGNITEVAAGNNSQAEITQEITRTLEQLAAATEEIAANAQNASSTSEETRKAAGEGAARVGHSIASLVSVQESVSHLARVSQQIDGIVSMIEGIADQTNLLALNAAIEAARAGEHGRGFAVVADAVRSLAEQSRQSTKEISRLISSIQGQITEAVRVSNEGAEGARFAQEALDDIVDKVNQIAVMVEEISAAGEEQAASANEVAASMQNLGAITEQVAASSQEAAAAGSQLAELGKALESAAKKFKI